VVTAGPLAFIGGGEWQVGCSFDQHLIESVHANEVVVMPTAAAYEHPEQAIARAESWFGQFGVSVRPVPVLARADAESPAMAEAISSARFIYLSDGSPLHLRSVLKDSLVWRAMVDAWHGGAAIAGSSAGATILGDPMVDPRGGTFTLGLGMIRNFAAVPHWERWTGNRARRMSHLTPPNAVVAEIEEQTALIRWGDGTWQTMGAHNTVIKVNNEPIDVTAIESQVETIPIVA
jgi:cyanophycinase